MEYKDTLLRFLWPTNTDSVEEQLSESQFIIKGKFHNHTPQAENSQSTEALHRNSLVTCRMKKGLNTYFSKPFLSRPVFLLHASQTTSRNCGTVRRKAFNQQKSH